MNANSSTCTPRSGARAGDKIVAAAIFLQLLSGGGVALGSDAPSDGYYERENRTADAIGNSIAIMPTYGVFGLCGALVLPADIYGKMKRPQDAFGAYAGNDVCIIPATVVHQSLYLAGGFPFFAGKKVLWELPRQVLVTHELRVHRISPKRSNCEAEGSCRVAA